MTPGLDHIAARIAACFAASVELSAQSGSSFELADFAKILRGPATGLTASQRTLLAGVSEAALVEALRLQFSSGRYDAALGREQPAQSH